jgi:hypothetical protein
MPHTTASTPVQTFNSSRFKGGNGLKANGPFKTFQSFNRFAPSSPGLRLDFLLPLLSQSESKILVDRVCARQTGRVEVATSRIGAQGILVETGGGCQER